MVTPNATCKINGLLTLCLCHLWFKRSTSSSLVLTTSFLPILEDGLHNCPAKKRRPGKRPTSGFANRAGHDAARRKAEKNIAGTIASALPVHDCDLLGGGTDRRRKAYCAAVQRRGALSVKRR